MTRVLPDIFRETQVHRLSGFFKALRKGLMDLARMKEDPRIVILTPGSLNETYFEHAYLANYLGCTLVQGGDLTVRDNAVWLKTLDGLQPVDVILRRVDDTFCDPLELRKDSLLGTPGLLQAARGGQVAIANPLGSGVLENPGMMAFLPVLARHLLGEDLRLPSVATWWCGGEKEREYVLANLHRLVIKPIAPHPSTATVFGAQLSTQARQALADQIRTQPHLFVGQEQVALSTTPVLATGGLQPRPMVLRSFLVAHDQSYVVMPGGLTRVAPNLDTWIVSNQRGGVSKDTWVLASEPEKDVSLLPPCGYSLPLTRTGGEVPGRVADNLFWLGRYAERAEGIARLLRVVVTRCLDAELLQDASLPMLLRVVTYQTATYPGFVNEGAEERLAAPEQELLAVMRDGQRTGSLRFTLTALTQVARPVRDRLSDDSWRVLNGLQEGWGGLSELSTARETLERLILGLAAFTGLSTEQMSRGQGWRFLDIGRRLERALFESSLLRAACVPTSEPTRPLWEAVLAMTDNLATYRRRYRSQAQADAVLDLVLLDESTPRSVAYQLACLHDQVSGLSRRATPPHRSLEERLLLEALTTLRLADIERLVQVPQGKGMREALDQLLSRLGYLLRTLSETITSNYFNQTDLPRQLVEIQ